MKRYEVTVVTTFGVSVIVVQAKGHYHARQLARERARSVTPNFSIQSIRAVGDVLRGDGSQA